MQPSWGRWHMRLLLPLFVSVDECIRSFFASTSDGTPEKTGFKKSVTASGKYKVDWDGKAKGCKTKTE